MPFQLVFHCVCLWSIRECGAGDGCLNEVDHGGDGDDDDDVKYHWVHHEYSVVHGSEPDVTLCEYHGTVSVVTVGHLLQHFKRLQPNHVSAIFRWS